MTNLFNSFAPLFEGLDPVDRLGLLNDLVKTFGDPDKTAIRSKGAGTQTGTEYAAKVGNPVTPKDTIDLKSIEVKAPALYAELLRKHCKHGTPKAAAVSTSPLNN